jgi:hypothetical protein
MKLKQYFDADYENKLKPYWWTSSIYMYYYLAKTYQIIGDGRKLNSIISSIKEMQNENGSFSDTYGESFFYTGLALEILLFENLEIPNPTITKTINFLISNQFNDGSWQNSHALQVPNSQDLTPISCHFPIASFGMNVRAKEFNRLFTTASILKSLSIYEQKYSPITF